MSKKGGYTLIDFGDINLTAGAETATNIPGVYERLVFNRRKLVRVTGLSVGGVKFPDTDAMVDIIEGGYNLYTPLYRINVTANGVIAYTVSSGGGGGKLYRHSISFYGDSYDDDAYMLNCLSTDATPVTDKAGVLGIARLGDTAYAHANGGSDYIGLVGTLSSSSIQFFFMGSAGFLKYTAQNALKVVDTVSEIQ